MDSSRLRPLRLRLRTATQRDVRSEKVARRSEEREAASLLKRAASRRKKS